MGMLMLGDAAVTFISYPVNAQFWGSEGPLMLGKALLAFLAGFLLVWGARHADRIVTLKDGVVVTDVVGAAA